MALEWSMVSADIEEGEKIEVLLRQNFEPFAVCQIYDAAMIYFRKQVNVERDERATDAPN